MTKLLIVFHLCVSCTYCFNALAQLECIVYDQESKLPVSEAHVFFTNTATGNFSDTKGHVKIVSSEGVSQKDLIISHIAYDIKILEPHEFTQLSKADTIWLVPNKIEIETLEIQSSRSGKWKKRLKQFKKHFLGKNNLASKCKILNPEVLRFLEEQGNLHASADEALLIENQYLGYKVHYYLTHFTLFADGSMEYLGKAYFDPYDGSDFDEKRDKIYRSSPKHFFKNLIDNTLEQAGYSISMSKKINDEFITLQTPPLENLMKPIGNGQYKFFFPEFLEVINHNIKSQDSRTLGVRAGGLESSRFPGTVAEESTKLTAVSSRIYKNAPYILLDKYGNVLNSKKVKEYGFWSAQRFAHQLPFEYGNENSTPIAADSLTNTKISDPLSLLKALVYEKDREIKKQTLTTIAKEWDSSMAPPLIDLLRLSADTWLVSAVQNLLVDKTAADKKDYFEWLQWLWEQPPMYSSYYSDFKALLYKFIDPKFETYFDKRSESYQIRPDEIVWGGVMQDGIPPLSYPKMISAQEADYLDDTDVIFGLYIDEVAHAYPKRILAWHEFFVDSIGSQNIAGVYCTLCGTVIPYVTDGHDLGTSGFLYRSNKLMYDSATQSLWSTIEGKPVVGPLVDSDIKLSTHHVVTTTWEEWKALHPYTKVLDIYTSYDRNYSEGNAYKEYYSTDNLMFPVPLTDERLRNKDEVLVIRTENYNSDPLAISIDYLKKKKWHLDTVGGKNIVIVSTSAGASRAYASEKTTFTSFKNNILVDTNGKKWKVTEEALLSDNNRKLERLSAHNIFWFAWINSYPETRLVK